MIEFSNKFTVEEIQSTEEYVYDIEVETNHNFFANNICVHNSCYFSFAEIAEKIAGGNEVSDLRMCRILDNFFEKNVQPVISAGYAALAEYTNTHETHLEMAREVIATSGLWKAKKAYALNVVNSEGVEYAEPYQKIMGLAAIKAETPEICRAAIKKTLKLILMNTEADVQNYIAEFKETFFNAPVADIAKNTGIKDMDKYSCESGFLLKTPYHVKAAMCYNRYIDNLQLNQKYTKIIGGDKVKLIYIYPENRTMNNVFAFLDFIPPEMDMEKYIDRKTQYFKVFYKTTDELVTIAGMTSEKKITLF